MTKKITAILAIFLMLTIMVIPASATENTIEKTISVVRLNLQTGDFTEEQKTISYLPEPQTISEDSNLSDPENLISPTEVIGEDTRSIVLTTELFPYSCIAHLLINFPSGHMHHGTAVIYDDNTALSSAHIFYNDENGANEWASYVTVFPGQLNNLFPFGDTFVTELIMDPAFINNGDQNYDWAVVKLNDPIGNETNCVELKAESHTIGKVIKVVGYPYSQTTEGIMYEGSGNILMTDSLRTFHSVDTYKGQSGAPVFNSQNQVIGIHQGASENHLYNTSIKITDELKAIFESHR